MKEKYIFFTLLIIVFVMLISAGLGPKAESSSAKQLEIEKKIQAAAKVKLDIPPELNIERVQALVAFSKYEAMLKRSPFFKVQPKESKQPEKPKAAIVPLEDKTPVFIYKGAIGAGSRVVVIIKQTRSGEVFMVSKGEKLDGYEVKEITAANVVLVKEGAEDIVLETTEKAKAGE